MNAKENEKHIEFLKGGNTVNVTGRGHSVVEKKSSNF